MTQIPEKLGKYQLIEVIGRGGVGEVYRAFQPDLNRTVAIKTLLAGEQASEDFIRRFKREASVAANLVHPNIVQVHDLGTEGRLHYIVMEYVEGRSLKEILAERKLDVREALELARSVARTLQFAHEKGIVHRDIKPANLVLDVQGKIRILDFGLAKSLAEGKGLTLTNVMMGTPCYMSPEQAFGAPDEVDARTDIYSLGAVLYEMVTGRLLFDGGTVLAILRKIEDEEPRAPGVSPAIDALVQRALAKDRERRFASAGAMADAIDAILSGAETLPVAPRPAPRPAGPMTWIWGLGAALLLVLLWAAWPPGGEKPSSPPGALEELLAQGTLVPDHELEPFAQHPGHRRRIAGHFLEHGQFGRAFEYLEDYDRAIAELASAGSLQRFVSPALYPVWMEVPEDFDGPRGFLLTAIRRHLAGSRAAAREKLGAAEAGGAEVTDVLLVRAHLDLEEALTVSDEQEREELVRALRDELEKAPADDLKLLPLKAIAAHLAEDPEAAWRFADRLRRRAPHAAETFLLRSILFQYEGRFELAMESLQDAERQHPGNLDPGIQGLLLRFLMILESGEPAEPDEFAEMRRMTEERLPEDPHPALLFLKAALDALESRFDEAREALLHLDEQVGGERIFLPPGHLDGLIRGIDSRALVLVAAAEIQEAVGRRDDARVTAEWALKQELPEEDRRDLECELHHRLSYLSEDGEAALHHLEEALKRGLEVDELDGEEFDPLRDRRAFRELREKYDR